MLRLARQRYDRGLRRYERPAGLAGEDDVIRGELYGAVRECLASVDGRVARLELVIRR